MTKVRASDAGGNCFGWKVGLKEIMLTDTGVVLVPERELKQVVLMRVAGVSRFHPQPHPCEHWAQVSMHAASDQIYHHASKQAIDLTGKQISSREQSRNGRQKTNSKQVLAPTDGGLSE